MSIKNFVKAVAPSPVWEYLRRKKAKINTLLALRGYMKSSSMEGFIILDDAKEYGKTGKIFGGEQYYSQAYQDYFLDRSIFRGKEGGFFLDIGGNDPVRINNTYFFEKSRGWSGLAFEPLASQRGKWDSLRKIECLPFALGSVESEAEFCEYEDDVMSGFSDEVRYSGKVKARYKVPVRRLTGILEERGIKHVDFVSLDVEGAEIEVLKGIDFSRVDIECFTIENDKGLKKGQRIRKFMTEAGYKIKARLWLDEVWIKDRVQA